MKKAKEEKKQQSKYIDTMSRRLDAVEEWEKHGKYAGRVLKKHGKAGVAQSAGRIVEDLAATTFNVDAIKRNRPHRAIVTAKIPGQQTAAADILVRNKSRVVSRVQVKMNKTVSKTTFNVSHAKYDGMQKVVASEQVKKVREIAKKASMKTMVTKRNYADTAKNVTAKVKCDGISGKGITRKAAISHAKNPSARVKREIKRELTDGLGDSLVFGAGASVVGSLLSNGKGVLDGDSRAVKRVLKDTATGTLDSGAKALVGAGITKIGTKAIKGNVAVVTAGLAVDCVKDAFDFFNDEIDGEEFLCRTGKNAFCAGGGWAGAELGAMCGAFGGPIGVAVGGVVGGILGSLGVGKIFS